MGCRSLNKPPIPPQHPPLRTDAAAHPRHALRVVQIRNQCDVAALPRAARRGIGLHAATVADLVGCAQQDAPALFHQATGLQAACVVHNAALQTAGRLGRQNDQPARRLDRVAVFHQGLHGGRRHHHIGQQPLAIELQGVRFAGSQCHCAHLRHHHAVVAHLGGQQRNVAAKTGLELPFVHNAAGGAVTHQGVAPGHEVFIAQAVGGGHEAAHFHAGTGGKVSPCRVDQKHLPRCGDAPKNLAGVVVQHAVQRDAAAVGLVEIDLCGRPHVEALPVDGRTLACLVNIHHGGALADGHLTRDHLSARGQLGGHGSHCPSHGCQHKSQQHRAQRATHHRGARAMRLGQLGDHHPLLGGLLPDDAVLLVHLTGPITTRRAHWLTASSGFGSGCHPGRCPCWTGWGCCQCGVPN